MHGDFPAFACCLPFVAKPLASAVASIQKRKAPQLFI